MRSLRISLCLYLILNYIEFGITESNQYFKIWENVISLNRNHAILKKNAESLSKASLDSFRSDLFSSQETTRTFTAELLSNTNTERCRNQTQVIIPSALSGEEWATQMIDAFGKPPPDILSFNTKWYGSYDECIKVKGVTQIANETEEIQGQYCNIYIPLNIQPDLLSDGGAVALVYGVCLPDTCSEIDALTAVNSLLNMLPVGNGTAAAGSYAICQEKELEYDTVAYVALVILGFLLALMLLGTGYDIICIQWPLHNNGSNLDSSDEKTPLVEKATEPKPKTIGSIGKILQAFSVYTNGKKILDTHQGSESLTAVNGVRFLSISWVLLGHTYIFALTVSANGRVFQEEMLKRWTFQAINNALVSVDSFFTLSGLLLSYLVLKEMEKKNCKINWFMFYFHRFWRLTPPYMLVMMVSATLTRYFGNGPNWPKAGFEIDQCRNSWWWNLLYINNFRDGQDMCMGWSWYLANDMQFFVLSPLMLIPLASRYSIIGLGVCMFFLLGTTVTAGVLSTVYDMPPSMFGGGGDPGNILDYTKWYYFKPFCRMGPYVIGIITGYILWKTKRKFKINTYLNLAIWGVIAALACTVLYGLHDPINNDPLSTEVSALYNATHRSLWGLCVCWVVFACATGNGGFVNTLLSWKPFVPLARLSYCVYLVHPIIMYTHYFSLRRPLLFTDNNMIYMFLGHLVLSNMVAFVTSLAFEAPMMGLEKVVFKRGEKK